MCGRSRFPDNGFLTAMGLSETAFIDPDKRIRNGDFGYVDRIVVVRDGQLVVDARDHNHYKTTSRDAPLGPAEDPA